MWMRYCWAWPPRSLSERTMWWWKMCEVRLRLSLQAMQPWPLGRSSVGAPESGREACRLGGRQGMGNLHSLIADGASDLQTTAPSVRVWLGSQGWWEPGHEVQELPQTLPYLIPRFLAWATEVFPHRPPGQLPAPGPGSGPALLHQGQGNPGPASSYQMAGHQPSPLPE